MNSELLGNILKTCSLCHRKLSARDLIFDPALDIIGMIYDEYDQKSFYVFQHNLGDCGTSLMVDTDLFKPYIEEPISDKLIIFSPACEGHCVDIDDLQACSQNCRNAPFRHFLLFMREQKAKKKVPLGEP